MHSFPPPKTSFCELKQSAVISTFTFKLKKQTMLQPLQLLPCCEISSCHGGKYEAQNLLECTAVFLIGCQSTFLRCVLRADDGGSTNLWNVGRIHLRTRQYIPEDSEIHISLFPVRSHEIRILCDASASSSPHLTPFKITSSAYTRQQSKQDAGTGALRCCVF
jgi:hypothetical protein